jgi:hypothetical protein
MQFSRRVTSHHELKARKFDEVVPRLELSGAVDQMIDSFNKFLP